MASRSKRSKNLWPAGRSTECIFPRRQGTSEQAEESQGEGREGKTGEAEGGKDAAPRGRKEIVRNARPPATVATLYGTSGKVVGIGSVHRACRSAVSRPAPG